MWFGVSADTALATRIVVAFENVLAQGRCHEGALARYAFLPFDSVVQIVHHRVQVWNIHDDGVFRGGIAARGNILELEGRLICIAQIDVFEAELLRQ